MLILKARKTGAAVVACLPAARERCGRNLIGPVISIFKKRFPLKLACREREFLSEVKTEGNYSIPRKRNPDTH